MGDLDQDVGESNNRSDSKKSGDKKPSFGSGWRWVILLAGWLSFALFSATLYTSGRIVFLGNWFSLFYPSINELNKLQVFSLWSISKNLERHVLKRPGYFDLFMKHVEFGHSGDFLQYSCRLEVCAARSTWCTDHLWLPHLTSLVCFAISENLLP